MIGVKTGFESEGGGGGGGADRIGLGGDGGGDNDGDRLDRLGDGGAEGTSLAAVGVITAVLVCTAALWSCCSCSCWSSFWRYNCWWDSTGAAAATAAPTSVSEYCR